jgi:AcrR family transcriptional regulator
MPRARDEEKWAARRDDIVDSAAKLFAAHSYHGTGVQELSDAVGLGRGVLYYYVTSKEHLLGLIHDRVMEHVLASADRVLATPGSASDRLAMLGRELIGIITTYPDHVWVFLHEFRALTGDEAKRFKDSRVRYEAAVRQILSDGVAAGEFELDDVELTALGWLGLHNYVYIWFHNDGRFTPQEIADSFSGIFLSGVQARGVEARRRVS